MQGFNYRQFMQEYWQKKPCVIKGFIPNFVDPLDEHDLAGLAQESEVDSRLISQQGANWQVTQGPIDDFEPLCKGAWILLVQGVDKYIDEVNMLTDQVSDIPHWRLEDVMVSFSNEGAGVGAHIDEYDVIIVQGKGRRRWQVGLPSHFNQLVTHPLLKQIDGFDAVIDQELAPGDAIYIPPKHPHNGVALTDCLNYSIGFRAPTDLELLAGIVDESEALAAKQTRYTDPDQLALRCAQAPASLVSNGELQALTQMLQRLLESEAGQQTIVQYLSRQALPELACDEEYTKRDTLSILTQSAVLIRAPGVRPLFKEKASDTFTFYIDGGAFVAPQEIAVLTQAFISEEATQLPLNLTKIQMSLMADLCTELLNAGYWYLENA
jgi:50S ribosomal protein L16 3-hydroxylase